MKVSQKAKYEKLSGKKRVREEGFILQGSNQLKLQNLNQATWTVLGKGLNFAIAPKTVPLKEFIGGFEQAVKDLPLSEGEDVRGEVVGLLKAVEPPQIEFFQVGSCSFKSYLPG